VGGEWKFLLELMTSMLVRPTHPDEQVARHKQRLLDRLEVERDDPRSQGGLVFRRLVYGEHWLGAPPTGPSKPSSASVRGTCASTTRATGPRGAP
jgi:predicted Zn-dependent peptidase